MGNSEKYLDKYLKIACQLNRLNKGIEQTNIKNASPFLANLIKTANDQNFLLYSCANKDPQVIIIGDYHPGGLKSLFFNEISSILRQCLSQGDKIRLEGPASGEIIQGISNFANLPISTLEDIILKKGVQVCFNDNRNFNLEQKKYNSIVFETKKQADLILSQNPKANVSSLLKQNQEYAIKSLELMEKRDKEYFCYGGFGIVQSIANTRKLYQIIGIAHIFSQDIMNILDKEKISYAILVPKKLKK